MKVYLPGNRAAILKLLGYGSVIVRQI